MYVLNRGPPVVCNNTYYTYRKEYFEIINNLKYVCHTRENFGNSSKVLTI